MIDRPTDRHTASRFSRAMSSWDVAVAAYGRGEGTGDEHITPCQYNLLRKLWHPGSCHGALLVNIHHSTWRRVLNLNNVSLVTQAIAAGVRSPVHPSLENGEDAWINPHRPSVLQWVVACTDQGIHAAGRTYLRLYADAKQLTRRQFMADQPLTAVEAAFARAIKLSGAGSLRSSYQYSRFAIGVVRSLYTMMYIAADLRIDLSSWMDNLPTGEPGSFLQDTVDVLPDVWVAMKACAGASYYSNAVAGAAALSRAKGPIGRAALNSAEAAICLCRSRHGLRATIMNRALGTVGCPQWVKAAAATGVDILTLRAHRDMLPLVGLSAQSYNMIMAVSRTVWAAKDKVITSQTIPSLPTEIWCVILNALVWQTVDARPSPGRSP